MSVLVTPRGCLTALRLWYDCGDWKGESPKTAVTPGETESDGAVVVLVVRLRTNLAQLDLDVAKRKDTSCTAVTVGAWAINACLQAVYICRCACIAMLIWNMNSSELSTVKPFTDAPLPIQSYLPIHFVFMYMHIYIYIHKCYIYIMHVYICSMHR